MKKILNKICGLTTLALLLASCTAIEHDAATAETILQARNTLTQSTASFLGSNIATGDEYYSLRLMSAGISVDYKASASGVISDNTYKGNGYIVLFDTLFVQSSGTGDFPTGTFDLANDFGSVYSIILHNDAAAVAAATPEKVKAVEGSVNITKTGDNYTITIEAVNINGTELALSYTGPIEVFPDLTYAYEPLTPSTQTFVIDDISFEVGNYDYERDGQMDFSLATLTLTTANVRIVIDEIIGQLYVIGNEPKRPLPGTYEIKGTLAYNAFSAGEIYRGALVGSYAWLLANPDTPSFSEMWYLVDAQMVVTETADAYTIALTATSANGSAITATYRDETE